MPTHHARFSARKAGFLLTCWSADFSPPILEKRCGLKSALHWRPSVIYSAKAGVFSSHFLSTRPLTNHGMNRASCPAFFGGTTGFFPARFSCAHDVSLYAVTTSLPKIDLFYPNIRYGYIAFRLASLYELDPIPFFARPVLLVPTPQSSLRLGVVKRHGICFAAHGFRADTV
jgi:hypothetical protein